MQSFFQSELGKKSGGNQDIDSIQDAEPTQKSKQIKGIKKQKKQAEKRQKKQPRKTKLVQKVYWISVMRYIRQNKNAKLSWQNWKADNFFLCMQRYFRQSQYIKQKLSKVQIKSLDQRLKKRYLEQNIDILQALPIALNEYELTDDEKNQLISIKNVKKQIKSEFSDISSQMEIHINLNRTRMLQIQQLAQSTGIASLMSDQSDTQEN